MSKVARPEETRRITMACFQNQLRHLENGALSNSSRVQPFHSCILEEFDGARNMSLDVAKFYSPPMKLGDAH